MKKFELKEEHLKLLHNLYIDDDGDVPKANWKRPYGNSDYISDVCEMLDFETEGDGFSSNYSEEQVELARELHDQTKIALQICLIEMKFELGTFVKTNPFSDRSWKRVEDGKISIE